MGTETGRDQNQALAYAALVRVPNLFTAPPDIVLGAALASAVSGGGGAAGVGAGTSLATIAGLAVASIFLYAAGTSLNDYADATADARARPDRPIPAGEVSRRAAFALSVLFLAAGIVVALVSAGAAGGAVAAAVALLIVLYDVVVEGGALAALLMGGARAANVLLGTTAGTDLLFPPPMQTPVLAVFPAVLAYVAAVTHMAETENAGGSRNAVLVAGGGALLAGVAVIGKIAAGTPGRGAAVFALVLTLGFLAWTGRALRATYANPVPGRVGPAVGTCILALVVLDGAFAATVSPGWGLAAVAFLVPAVGFARAFDVT